MKYPITNICAIQVVGVFHLDRNVMIVTVRTISVRSMMVKALGAEGHFSEYSNVHLF